MEKTFKDIIKAHLDQRAQQDELFAKTYAKPGKTLEECCRYIMGEARKRGTAVCMADDEVFGLAAHYYDEDDIEVSPAAGSCRAERVEADTLTEEEMQEAHEEARRKAIERLAEEQYAAMHKKANKPRKKEQNETAQMSLFG